MKILAHKIADLIVANEGWKNKYTDAYDLASLKILELPELKVIQMQAEVKPANTDIDKQEKIVTILSQFLDEVEIDDRIILYRKLGESTPWEGKIIRNTLEKLLALDGLNIIPID